jgi:hypothetical protein
MPCLPHTLCQPSLLERWSKLWCPYCCFISKYWEVWGRGIIWHVHYFVLIHTWSCLHAPFVKFNWRYHSVQLQELEFREEEKNRNKQVNVYWVNTYMDAFSLIIVHNNYTSDNTCFIDQCLVADYLHGCRSIATAYISYKKRPKMNINLMLVPY